MRSIREWVYLKKPRGHLMLRSEKEEEDTAKKMRRDSGK